jgi:aspartate oxidase
LRAGATLTDLEFVQFHPTTLHSERDPRPLISEAMRGEGAVLRDGFGASVTAGIHPLGDLAPRDIVSRAMFERMRVNQTTHLYLDATDLGTRLADRFPTIVASCRSLGIDPVSEWIPVSPAAHYTMGGIRADLDGRTNLEGLFAVGEVAATGVHGANRLASNSLLEGVVFGRRVAAAIDGGPLQRRPLVSLESARGARRARGEGVRHWLRRAMVDRAGIIRSGEGLRLLLDEVTEHLDDSIERSVAAFETENLLEVATGLALLASVREESRGAHHRSDHPTERDGWMRHQILARSTDGMLELGQTEPDFESGYDLLAERTVAAVG